jgi:hypothetical protein
MEIEIATAMKTAEQFQSLEGFSEAKELMDGFASEVGCGEGENHTPEGLKNNQDYLQLRWYLKDARQLVAVNEIIENRARSWKGMSRADRIDLLLEGLARTETDLMTYLENFVADDTEFSSVREYALHEFGTEQAFSLNLLRGYFGHNLWYFLDKLEKARE